MQYDTNDCRITPMIASKDLIPEELKTDVFPPALQPSVSLHTEQILIEVIALMNSSGENSLPVYDDNKTQLGTISLSDILIFLEHESEKNLYHHKLNYTVESLLVLKHGMLQRLF